MNEQDKDELHGRMEAVLIALKLMLNSLDPDSPLRREIVDELGKSEASLAQTAPGSDWLYGFKEARADMGLGRSFMSRPPRNR